MRRQIRLEIINGFLFALAVLGISIPELFELQLSTAILVVSSIVLAGAYTIIAIRKTGNRERRFKEYSRAWRRFFESWYKEPGELTLVCNDLHWLEHQHSHEIVESLRLKPPQLTIYARHVNSPVRDILEQAGATIYQIPAHLETRHRFSIRESGGIIDIIVRNKDRENDDIVFISTNNYLDPYLASLLKDILMVVRNEQAGP